MKIKGSGAISLASLAVVMQVPTRLEVVVAAWTWGVVRI
jgi:hypothetical protein